MKNDGPKEITAAALWPTEFDLTLDGIKRINC